MGAQRLYGIGHLAKRADVSEAVIRQWEIEGILPTVGKDRRRFTTEAVVRAMTMSAAARKKGVKVPVVAPGALAAAERERTVKDTAGKIEQPEVNVEGDGTPPAWKQVDMERFIPPAARTDRRKRIAARYYADAYRALRAADASQAEAIWRIAEAYQRTTAGIAQALVGLGVIPRVRGREEEPEAVERAVKRQDGMLEDQYAILRDLRDLYRRLVPSFRAVARETIFTEE